MTGLYTDSIRLAHSNARQKAVTAKQRQELQLSGNSEFGTDRPRGFADDDVSSQYEAAVRHSRARTQRSNPSDSGTDHDTTTTHGDFDTDAYLNSSACDKDELLAYYRSQIDSFESERAQFLANLKQVEVSRKDFFSLRWELQKRNDEIAELQKALSDAHVYLYDEREQVLKLQAENDEMKVQEIEDRKRIQHLLALTNPTHQEVTYFKDVVPDTLARRFPHKTVQPVDKPIKFTHDLQGRPIRPHTAAVARKSSKSSAYASYDQHYAENPPILRTVYLPSESADSLRMIIDSLRNQLQEQARLHSDRVSALLEDRRIREEESRLRDAHQKDKLEALLRELQEQSALHRDTTRDYLQLRRKAKDNERQWTEELDRLRQQTNQAQAEAEAAKQLQVDQSGAIRAQAQADAEDYAQRFRKQAMDREEDLLIVKEQYAAAQRLYENKINELSRRLKALQSKHKSLTQRRQGEITGFLADTKVLRRQVRNLEKVLVHIAWDKGHSNNHSRNKRDQQSSAAASQMAGDDLQHIKDHLAQMCAKLDL